MEDTDRELTDHERRLLTWLLEHGNEGAASYLPQLAKARVLPWKCACGCPSFHLKIGEYPVEPSGVHPLADFFYGSDETLSGIFVYESIPGVLAGLEVYGLVGKPVSYLPEPAELRASP